MPAHPSEVMDIDIVEENEAAMDVLRGSGRHTAALPIDEAHPFDLEAYISSYSGRTVVDRLLQIISLCPIVAAQAVQLALAETFQMRDTRLYRTVLSQYEQVAMANPELLPPVATLAPLNQKWVDETNQRNQAERMKLEVELKTYTSNMIKESIRMAHRDLGDFYRATGDHASALKHLTKSREFCTSSQHVLDMCFSVLELLIEHRNYAHISTYIFKADAALDTSAIARMNSASGSTASANQPTKEKISAEREKVQSRLDAALGLALLGQGNYEKAALAFIKVGPAKGLGEWNGQIITPADIAVYATLCALATFSRTALRAQVLDNDTFGVYIEQEPYVREVLDAYMGNRFKGVLDILERNSTRHAIDIHLAPHMVNLTSLIRSRALVLYFQPFATIKLDRMSVAFGWSVDELEEQVVSLIQSGEIQARVDRQNKILKAKETDQRAVLFARAITSGRDMQSVNRKLLLRMRLQQADLVVKAPRSNQQSMAQGSLSDNLRSDLQY